MSEIIKPIMTDETGKAIVEAIISASDQKQRVDEIDTKTKDLQSQIDNIISPVTEDAEVQNLRIGVDGKSYPTAKSRVDAEITNVKEGLGEIQNNTSISHKNYTDAFESIGIYIPFTGSTSLKERNVQYRIDGLKLNKSQYKYTFSIDTPVGSAVYFGIYDGVSETYKWANTIPAGQTSVTAQFRPTEIIENGYITIQSGVTGIVANVKIELYSNPDSLPKVNQQDIIGLREEVLANTEYSSNNAKQISIQGKSIDSLADIVETELPKLYHGDTIHSQWTPIASNIKLTKGVQYKIKYSIKDAIDRPIYMCLLPTAYSGSTDNAISTFTMSAGSTIVPESGGYFRMTESTENASIVVNSYAVVDVTAEITPVDGAINAIDRIDGEIETLSVKTANKFDLTDNDISDIKASIGSYQPVKASQEITERNTKITVLSNVSEIYGRRYTYTLRIKAPIANSGYFALCKADDTVLFSGTLTAGTTEVSRTRYALSNDTDMYVWVQMPVAPIDVELVIDREDLKANTITNSPLTLLPDYVVHNLAYKPLGALDKGYICLTTDDGCEDGTLGVCSYTIPLSIAKNVPFTFSMMSTSQVFTREDWTNTLLDAIENHNCSVAQHGVTRFTTYSEKELNDYFNEEEDFFKSKGITPKGAVCPTHVINDMVRAVAGGRFGVVRSGYQGGTESDIQTYYGDHVENFYNYYTSGANSNKYGLSSFNIAAKPLNYSKAAIDYAKANNKILIALFHEFTEDIPNEATKQKISDVIDYAKQVGLEFIRLEDIPKLPFADTSTF